MDPNLLILGGTSEASALARATAAAGIPATLSLAGRVARPRLSPLPQRIGGFGGIEGLSAYLRDHVISHVIDATHPFAAQMSAHAAAATDLTGVPLVALTRPPWTLRSGDDWRHVPDMAGAAQALAGPARRVFLAIGRLQLAVFAAQPQHHYVLRLVDPPEGDAPLPDCHSIVARGPFTEGDDRALLNTHKIDVVVSKNAGGAAAYSKIAAARALGLPVIMVDRPTVARRLELTTAEQVLDWVRHTATPRGV